MEVLIIGGGNVGSTIAKKLISENHDVTIIEMEEQLVNQLNNELDALVIKGDGNDYRLLKKIKAQKVEIFLAVTNNDKANIIACTMAKKITNNKAITIAKVEDYFYYFSDDGMTHDDFGIDEIIAAIQVSIKKISTLIDEPKAIESISFMSDRVKIVGIEINEDYKYLNHTLKDFVNINPILQKIRIIAILRNSKVLIPNGEDKLLNGDKIYVIGQSEDLRYLLHNHFDSGQDFKKIIIIGGNRLGRRLAGFEAQKGKTVIIIENDKKICEDLSGRLNNVMIINGSATDKSILEDIGLDGSCIVATTKDDEYNIISSVLAKKHGCWKTICVVRNIGVAPIIQQLQEIDVAFSPDVLTTGEILRYCRKGNIVTVTSFSEIEAETMKIKISEEIKILNKPICEINFPKNALVGAIRRGEEVFIPSGNDQIMLNDEVIIFMLRSSINDVETIFSKK